MNIITASQTLIGSLHKSFDLASLNGNLKLKNLYLLNLINKYIYGCGSAITFNQKQYLLNLAIAIENLDKNICKYREQRSIYTNIVGCKNCKNVNQSDYIVINDAPTIGPDTDIPVNVLKPIVCDIQFHYPEGLSGLLLNIETFTKCFDYEDNVDSYSTLKITELPIKGVLYNSESNINVNDTISLTDLPFILKYLYTEDVYPTEDNFKFQISTNETDPEVFSNDYIGTIKMI
jgi:hypothetical protein